MTTSSKDDPPFGIFRLGYSAFVWASVALLTLATVWVMWKMFVLTPAGTRQTQELVRLRPTQEALAAEVVARMDPCYVPPPEAAVCAACHVIGNQGNQTCPSLKEIGKTAKARIADPSYTGSATTVEEYIRESVLTPSAYVVPSPAGKVYGSPGKSIMPENQAKSVPDFEALVAYLVASDPDKVCEKAAATPGAY